MRWISALLLCVLVASGMIVTTQSPPAVAMQVTPSTAARELCPEAEEDWDYSDVIFSPGVNRVEVGSVLVRDLTNPYPDPTPDAVNPNPEPLPDSGHVVMTLVALPKHTCILGSHFYPSMVMTVTSGKIAIRVEHIPGIGDAPTITVTPLVGNAQTITLAPGGASPIFELNPGDWVTIENEALIGFANQTDDPNPATFTVAGIKMAGDPGGGGGHRTIP